jgi:hypothetical protein
MSETSMIDPLGGADGDPGVSTTYVGDPGVSTTYIRDIDGGPLGGTIGDPGAPTT